MQIDRSLTTAGRRSIVKGRGFAPTETRTESKEAFLAIVALLVQSLDASFERVTLRASLVSMISNSNFFAPSLDPLRSHCFSSAGCSGWNRRLRVLCECGMSSCGPDTGDSSRRPHGTTRAMCSLLVSVEDEDGGGDLDRRQKNAVECQRVSAFHMHE